ncbi:MAG: hypothetical protein JWM00_696 [Candidatus Saccharibacteria bacterium]|nr:hypothetical protein [Candidatus Saccharibacteria bacterium]
MSKIQKTKAAVKKSSIGVLGGLVVVLGLIMVPYPGPGWLVVFAGLAILATEFDSARRVLDFAKGKYDGWQAWLKHQRIITQLLFWLLTFAIVVLTIWLLNGYGIINDLFHLGWDWVRSPLPFFSN